MCCPLQTHVRIISIICLIATGGSGLNILRLLLTGHVTYFLNLFFHADIVLEIVVQICIFLVHLPTYILSFIATFKQNKFMLIPFLIVTSIQLVFVIVFAAYVIIIWTMGILFIGLFTEENTEEFFSALGGILLVIFLIPVFSVLGILVYFLIVVAKLFCEIHGRIESTIPPTITIQQCTPSINIPGHPYLDGKGDANVYDPGGTPSAPVETPPCY